MWLWVTVWGLTIHRSEGGMVAQVLGAGHIAGTVRKQREMKAGAPLMFSFFFSLVPPGHGMAALVFSGLPS